MSRQVSSIIWEGSDGVDWVCGSMARCMVESIFITLEPGQQERRLWIPNRSLKLMDAVQARDPLAAVPEKYGIISRLLLRENSLAKCL